MTRSQDKVLNICTLKSQSIGDLISDKLTLPCAFEMRKGVKKETNETFTHEFFIDSSNCWLENKKKNANGTYKYSCKHIYESGKVCGRAVEHVHN